MSVSGNDLNKTLIQFCLSQGWGGLEFVSLEMAQNTPHCVTVCSAGSPLHKNLKEKNLPHFAVKSRKYFSPITTFKIRKFLSQHSSATLLMQHLADLWIVIPATLMLQQNFKVVGISHTFLSVSKKDIFHNFLYKRVHKLICLTQIHKKNLQKNLPMLEQNLVVIPNAVNLERFHAQQYSLQVREKLGVGKNDFLIAVIGRLDKKKGQFEAIDCADILQHRDFKFKMIFVGEDTPNDPGTGDRLKSTAEIKHLDQQVVFAGFHSQIESIVASVDLLLMPSDSETFGRILLEAMASRVPIVATNSGGVPDIIQHGVHGLLVSPRNPYEMANAIQMIMVNQDLRDKIVENAFNKVTEHYALPKIEKEIKNILF